MVRRKASPWINALRQLNSQAQRPYVTSPLLQVPPLFMCCSKPVALKLCYSNASNG